MSSLSEFRHLTLPQIRLFVKTLNDEHARLTEERKRNKQLKERQGGTVKVMG